MWREGSVGSAGQGWATNGEKTKTNLPENTSLANSSNQGPLSCKNFPLKFCFDGYKCILIGNVNILTNRNIKTSICRKFSF